MAEFKQTLLNSGIKVQSKNGKLKANLKIPL